ncbi:MAG: glycosyltransferase family 39 protein, partial [Bacteroidota bacterium]|nr:glycosyltransferase family 39 protein [Bacteroidota bacterium]
SVLLIFHIVKRSFGKAAGIASAAILGLTPILIAVSRTNNLDSSLVMVLLFATWVLIVAAERGSFKLLLLSMALVGVGFNIKMLEAFMVLPAFYLVYLFASPLKIGKRILQLAGATVILFAVSLSWAVVVDLTPADSRPYIDSSKTNSVLELALGYNGIQRVTGNQSMGGQFNSGNRPNAIGSANMANNNSQNNNGQLNNQTQTNNGVNTLQNNSQGNNNRFEAPPNDGNGGPGDGNVPEGFNGGPGGPDGFGGPNGQGGQGGPGNGGSPGGTQENGQKGILRIFNQNLAGQISWFLPMALFGILMLSFRAFKKDESSNRTVTRHLILFTALIVPMIGFFSVAGFYHRYYLSMLAPGIAALAGIGIVEMWKVYMGRGLKWVILPVALLANAGIQVLILSKYAQWDKYLIYIVSGVCVLTAAALVAIRLIKKYHWGKTIRITVIAAFASLLIAPAVWAYTPIIYGSQSGMPVAGPELQKDDGMGQNHGRSNLANRDNENASSSQLVKFLLSKYNGEKYLVAVSDSGSAESIILETGKPVMSVGGFSGNDNILTVAKLEQMVKNGEIRYFEIGGRGMGQNSEITTWVTENGQAVTLDNSSSSSTTADDSNHGFHQFGDRMGSGTLYDLAPEKG